MGRQVVVLALADSVAGADLDPLEPVEHVDLGQRDAGDPADRGRLAHEHRVEPAAAAFAPRHRSEFAAACPQPLAGGPLWSIWGEFGREGAAPDPRGVSLDDAEHEARRRRSGSAPRAARPGDRVGRGDERIGPVIDVEQHALRPLEQDPPPAPPRLVEIAPHRARERQNEVGDFGEVVP